MNVCCDSHLKIQHVDSNRQTDNDGKVRYRIYFCVKDVMVHSKNLLIGLIGPLFDFAASVGGVLQLQYVLTGINR